MIVLCISILGSLCSIAGLAVSIYVYRKEQVIQSEVELLDARETERHRGF